MNQGKLQNANTPKQCKRHYKFHKTQDNSSRRTRDELMRNSGRVQRTIPRYNSSYASPNRNFVHLHIYNKLNLAFGPTNNILKIKTIKCLKH